MTKLGIKRGAKSNVFGCQTCREKVTCMGSLERDVKLEMFDDQLTGIHAMFIPNYILSRENIGSECCTLRARAKRTLQANAKQYNGELLVLGAMTVVGDFCSTRYSRH